LLLCSLLPYTTLFRSRQGLLVEFNFVNAAVVIMTLTAGSTLLMWIGERITEKGVGNGISIVLLINILSRIPQDFVTLYSQFMSRSEEHTSELQSRFDF